MDLALFLQVQGKLISLSDNTRAYDGYILICDDPGPKYTQVVFRSHVAAHHHLLLTVDHTLLHLPKSASSWLACCGPQCQFKQQATVCRAGVAMEGC